MGVYKKTNELTQLKERPLTPAGGKPPRQQPAQGVDFLLSKGYVSEDTLELWDRQGVPTELLQHLRAHENELLAKTGGPQAPLLAAPMREACLRLAAQAVAMERGASQEIWFATTNLLDIYCSRVMSSEEDELRLEDLPAITLSAAWLVLKMDGRQETSRRHWLQLPQLTQLVQWLRSGGYLAEDVTLETWHRQELKMVKGMGWKVDVPCLPQFQSAYCIRYNSLTGFTAASSLRWVECQGLILARVLMMRRPASLEFTQRELSLGLTCLGFIAAGLVPPLALRPEAMSEAAWQELYLQSQPSSNAAACTAASEEVPRVLAALQCATDSSLDELKETTARVSSVLRCALAEIHHLQRASAAVQAVPLHAAV